MYCGGDLHGTFLLLFLVTWPWTNDLLSLSFTCSAEHRKAYLGDYNEKTVHIESFTAVGSEHLLGTSQ